MMHLLRRLMHRSAAHVRADAGLTPGRVAQAFVAARRTPEAAARTASTRTS